MPVIVLLLQSIWLPVYSMCRLAEIEYRSSLVLCLGLIKWIVNCECWETNHAQCTARQLAYFEEDSCFILTVYGITCFVREAVLFCIEQTFELWTHRSDPCKHSSWKRPPQKSIKYQWTNLTINLKMILNLMWTQLCLYMSLSEYSLDLDYHLDFPLTLK